MLLLRRRRLGTFVLASLLGLAFAACDARSSTDAAPPAPDAIGADGGGDETEEARPSCDGGVTWASSGATTWSNDDARHYAYAPSVILEDDRSRMFMCRNAQAAVVRDHIFYAERHGDAPPSAPRLVFGPGPDGAWDSFHVCDPSVTRGQFALGGAKYAYAMFYTGNDKDDIGHCQLGVAFSTTLDDGGVWVRRSVPLVAHPDDGTWGVGQPTAIDLDGGGKVVVLYTRADPSPHVYARTIDLSDADHPELGAETRVTEDGLVSQTGARDVLTNVDLALDRETGRAFVVTERHPLPTDPPAGIAASLAVVSLPLSDVLAGTGRWRLESVVDAALTGSPRNHNAGLGRAVDGSLRGDGLELYSATTCATCSNDPWLFHVGIEERHAEICAPAGQP